jgi:hypothetical protein
MRLYAIAIAMSAALAAGCSQESEPRVSSNAPAKNAPTTASAGASSAASGGTIDPAKPKGDSVPLPATPPGNASSADAKPDPGDANDHSNPQHDAKSKKNGD